MGYRPRITCLGLLQTTQNHIQHEATRRSLLVPQAFIAFPTLIPNMHVVEKHALTFIQTLSCPSIHCQAEMTKVPFYHSQSHTSLSFGFRNQEYNYHVKYCQDHLSTF